MEMVEKDEEVSKLNETTNEMLSKAPSGSLQDLARSLMRMNTLWTHTYQQVDHYYRLFASSDQSWKQFKGRVETSFFLCILCFCKFKDKNILW